MTQSFLAKSSEANNTPVSSPTPEEGNPEREPLKHILMGSPKAVTGAIHALHARGYAEVGSWSPLVPTSKVGEVISILLRYIPRE